MRRTLQVTFDLAAAVLLAVLALGLAAWAEWLLSG